MLDLIVFTNIRRFMIRMYTYLYYEAKVYVRIIHYFPVYLCLFIYICTYIRMYIGEVKTLMIQLLRGVHHLHDNWMLHRDLKTSNLLLSHQGILKIGDFGLAREYGSPLKAYSTNIITLWYRCPELLLGATKYSTAVDMWSVGCIFGELLLHKALFPGKSEIDQLQLLFKVRMYVRTYVYIYIYVCMYVL